MSDELRPKRKYLSEYPNGVRQVVQVWRVALALWPISLVLVAIILVTIHFERKHDKACAEMRALAGADSTRLQRAVAFCAGDGDNSTYVPMPILIPSSGR